MSRQLKLSFCSPSPPKRQRIITSSGENSLLHSSSPELRTSPPRAAADTAAQPAPSSSWTGHEGTSTHRYSMHDIGVIMNRVPRMSDADKYTLILDPYVPPADFIFPKHAEHGKQRSFQYSWLTKYPWLVYSRYLDGGFRLACVLFSKGGGGCIILVQRGMCKFTKASDHLKEHAQKRAHHIAIKDMETFRSVMEQKTLPVHHQLQSAVQLQIERNRAKLLSILKTVIFCGRQNISFRGHRDDSRYFNDDSGNSGNFQALLDFRIEAGDEILKEHFKSAPRNATYRSKTIQNELIDCIASWIRRKLVDEVSKACLFSILADETTDCSNKEQLTLVIRFADNQNQIREEFLDFVEVPSTTVEALAKLLLKHPIFRPGSKPYSWSRVRWGC